MKAKTTIRYRRFRPAADGGRIFDFSISDVERPEREISVEIPVTFFEGLNRLHLQEGVGISYAKIKHFLEMETETKTSPETHTTLFLNAVDLAQHREVAPVPPKRRQISTSSQLPAGGETNTTMRISTSGKGREHKA